MTQYLELGNVFNTTLLLLSFYFKYYKTSINTPQMNESLLLAPGTMRVITIDDWNPSGCTGGAGDLSLCSLGDDVAMRHIPTAVILGFTSPK